MGEKKLFEAAIDSTELTLRIAEACLGMKRPPGKSAMDDLFRALKQLKHVLDVRPVVADPSLTVAEARARRDMQEKFYTFYCETFKWETSKEGSR